ncbi:glutathione S-transferase family protein [Yoonia sediminilitoris]|uniref:Putative glutathione S-transferase n=1 Tax=Yoonia sediminilitoris TaxID=1286148 RepID=A0A2T6KN05_9RHOB|nr:glutathione S-transferase C-terminal domain-containing protein [Yoonia sediminilitoris]PUB17608.1 putative glutathione S-transferase [Yoonia sediminilitoris]RCW97903.1 putative glutathione S-transferase [Yoonia sediminilitoris]
MGYMVDGIYHLGDDPTATLPSGEFERSRSTVRNWIGESDFPVEVGRYHLFVAWNCPWAHRALLTRALLGLDDLTVSYARPNRTDQGWVFDADGAFSDPILGAQAIHNVYSADPMGYTGRLTVPVLWDKVAGRMVSNESADIVRMLGALFGQDALYPAALRDDIDRWNDLIYRTVNNGVYRAGFATTQEAYENAAREVFATLDEIDAHLATSQFLCGDQFTEADLRLFPTLARFDVAYHYAFRCNLRKIADYAHLWPYAKAIYAMPGVADTVRFDIYKQGYFSASEKRNPLGIIPIGPTLDWEGGT